jgi:hypothetical protein
VWHNWGDVWLLHHIYGMHNTCLLAYTSCTQKYGICYHSLVAYHACTQFSFVFNCTSESHVVLVWAFIHQELFLFVVFICWYIGTDCLNFITESVIKINVAVDSSVLECGVQNCMCLWR